MPHKIRVLLVDDNTDFLEMAPEVLSAHFEVVGKVSDVRKLDSAIVEYDPEVVVVDVNLPDTNGVSVARFLSKSNPALGIVLTSAAQGRAYERDLLSIGAHAYVDKLRTIPDLANAIKVAFQSVQQPNRS